MYHHAAPRHDRQKAKSSSQSGHQELSSKWFDGVQHVFPQVEHVVSFYNIS
jgi:hypothetical protein